MWFLLAACGKDAFYEDPVPHLDRHPLGDVLRFDRIGRTSAATLGWKNGGRADHGVEVYRILYRTTGLDGEPDVASARLAIPDDDAATRPIVAHLHGTTGLADRCAPSRDGGFGFEASVNPDAARMLADGAIVVEPDYLGLGPPGPHPYTAAVPTGESVLDAIRAAGRFADPDHDVQTSAPDRVLLEGHSQGGHAVLATLAEAPSYAPELPITAAVALAAPGAPRDLLAALIGDDDWGGFVAMATIGWSYAHPELAPPDDWVADDRTLDRLDHDCLLGLGGLVGDPPSELLAPDVEDAVVHGDYAAVGLDTVLDQEDLGTLHTDADLLIVHGTDDDLLPIELTEALAGRIALGGSPVTFVPIPGGDHLMLPWSARDVTLPFLEDHLTDR